MTTKLTLTIDDSVIHSAKKYAESNNRSLSHVVENYLKTLSSTPKDENAISPKVLKLLGVIKLPKDFDYKKEISNAIIKKHLK
jgi:Family of unknown function (DUF6364)